MMAQWQMRMLPCMGQDPGARGKESALLTELQKGVWQSLAVLQTGEGCPPWILRCLKSKSALGSIS